LDARADVFQCNSDGWTCLHYAAMNSQEDRRAALPSAKDFAIRQQINAACKQYSPLPPLNFSIGFLHLIFPQSDCAKFRTILEAFTIPYYYGGVLIMCDRFCYISDIPSSFIWHLVLTFH
jgi:hypothetical protein